MPVEAPVFPLRLTHTIQRLQWPLIAVVTQQWAPFGSWRVWNGTLHPKPPCLCCWDWFNRQRQLIGGVSPTGYEPHTHTHTTWHSTQTPPLLRKHTLTRLTKQPSPCPLLSQYKSDFSRERTTLLDYCRPSQKEYICFQSSAKPHRPQQDGE